MKWEISGGQPQYFEMFIRNGNNMKVRLFFLMFYIFFGCVEWILCVDSMSLLCCIVAVVCYTMMIFVATAKFPLHFNSIQNGVCGIANKFAINDFAS